MLSSGLLYWLLRWALGLQKYLESRYLRGVCSIVIPAAYFYAEGCIIFTCLFVFEANIRAYNIVSSAVLIYTPPGVLPPQQMLLSRRLYWLHMCVLTFACRTVLAADFLGMFATLLYPRYICMLKGVLFSLFTSSLRLISGHAIMSPQQYWGYILVCSIVFSAMLISGLAVMSTQQGLDLGSLFLTGATGLFELL